MSDDAQDSASRPKKRESTRPGSLRKVAEEWLKLAQSAEGPLK